ncbi:hypothetical protein, partial [Rhizobium pusense]|uniref:hypothetical protein n=1 Tax=Agrobacterium pusense TaxID=648995 RepID=UPI001AEDDF79
MFIGALHAIFRLKKGNIRFWIERLLQQETVERGHKRGNATLADNAGFCQQMTASDQTRRGSHGGVAMHDRLALHAAP